MIRIDHGLYRSGDFSLSCNFEVADGEFCAVLGPSGAGKSTLLSVLAGFEQLASGRIYLGGLDVTTATPAARPVSMVFQDNNVFPHLTVEQNVALGISPSLRLTTEQKHRVADALEQVQLSTLSGRRPGDISGGERQRVALARVLVRRSKLLLLDEPFAALDPGLRCEMLDEVVSLAQQRDMTVLLVTHQPDEIRKAASQVIFVNNGIANPPLATSAFFSSQAPDVLAYLGRAPTSRATSTKA